MPAPRFASQRDNDIVREARENCKRDPETNAIDERELIAEVESRMPFDAVRERRKKAVRMVQAEGRPGKTQPDGSLWLPGFEPKAYEPERLIPDGEGQTVEFDLATPRFYAAYNQRAYDALQKQEKAFLLTNHMSREYSEWAADQALDGRPANEITVGNFVRGRGYWKAEPIDGDDDDDEE